jgi:N-acetylglucosaminyl-diphospho-decaprenol L-rhamnosyltransferase
MECPDVSIVLVSFNVRDLLASCLAAVRATVHAHTYEVFVVDNASTDGSPEMVSEQFPDVTLIALDSNPGFSRANNHAIHKARGRHVLLLNCDTRVEPGAVDRMIDFLDACPRAGVVAPLLLNEDMTDQGTARAFPTPAAAVFGRRSPLTRAFPRNRWSRRYLVGRHRHGDEPFEVDWVSGACLAVPRPVVEGLGGLDEGFFMYWEDADLCRRIKATGRSVHCVPSARVIHLEGRSRRGWPARHVWIFHQSVFRYYAKHHARGWAHPARPAVAAGLVARAGLIVSKNLISQLVPPRPARAVSNLEA